VNEHLVFVWKTSGYELLEQEGDPPTVGAAVQRDGETLFVTKIAPSPLPRDTRVCVYLSGE
jgi:hypothetical protein